MRLKFTLLLLIISSTAMGQGNGLYQFIGKNGKYGFMDKTGFVKVLPKYLIVKNFNEGLCFVSKEVVTKGYKWICIDTLGHEVFDIQDNFPETDFSEGFARISSFTELWFINKKGENAFNKTWKDGWGGFYNGLAFVSDIQFSHFYPIDTNGLRAERNTYSAVEVYKRQKTQEKSVDTLIKFKEDSLWGFKNLRGKIVIKPQFYLVDGFQNGLCAVRLHHQSFEIANDYYLDAIINSEGQIVNQTPMHCYLGFQGDLIVYYGSPHFGGGVHYIDKNGHKVVPRE